MGGEFVIDGGSLAQWASAAAALVAVVISAASFVRSARKAEIDVVHKRITDVKEVQASHAERLARTEAELEHLPTREMVLALATSLARLEGDVGGISSRLDAFNDRIKRIDSSVEQLVENELRGPRT